MKSAKAIIKQRWFHASLAAAFALLMFVGDVGDRPCRSAHASDTLPSDYCYQMDISITYTGAPTLVDQSFRIPINALGLINANQMDARGWDLLPTQGSLSNEIDVMTQDLNNTNAAFWFHVPSLVQDQTKTIRMYLGSPEQKRNQGVLMTGSDDMDASDSAVMDIADDLTLDVEFELLTDTVQDATLASHYNTGGGDGYRMMLVDDLGVMKVRAQADTFTCDIAWDSSWTNTNQLFTMRFLAAAGNDLFIDRDGSNENACDTDLASITPPAGSPDFESGDDMASGIIREIRLVNATTIAARWGFDGLSMAESSFADPTAIGTIQDYGPNNLDMTYTFTRSQTDISGVVGSLQLVSASEQVTFDPDTLDILGSPFGGPLENVAAPDTDENIFFVLWVQGIVDGTDAAIPRAMGFVIALSTLGIVLMLLMWRLVPFIPLAIFMAGVPPAIGMIKNWIEPWWLILWAIIAFGVWMSIRQQEQA